MVFAAHHILVSRLLVLARLFNVVLVEVAGHLLVMTHRVHRLYSLISIQQLFVSDLLLILAVFLHRGIFSSQVGRLLEHPLHIRIVGVGHIDVVRAPSYVLRRLRHGEIGSISVGVQGPHVVPVSYPLYPSNHPVLLLWRVELLSQNLVQSSDRCLVACLI